MLIQVAPKAVEDLERVVDYYLLEAGVDVAIAFNAAWDRCQRHIVDFPQSGSLRLAEELELPGLRVWPVRHYPYFTFYTHESEIVTVVRVLHTSRDLNAAFRE